MFIVIHSVLDGDEFKTDIHNFQLLLFVLAQLVNKKIIWSVLGYSNCFGQIQTLVLRSLFVVLQHMQLF